MAGYGSVAEREVRAGDGAPVEEDKKQLRKETVTTAASKKTWAEAAAETRTRRGDGGRLSMSGKPFEGGNWIPATNACSSKCF